MASIFRFVLLLLLLLLLLIVFQGCKKSEYYDNANRFLSSNDTLIIRTEKVQGSGLFSLGSGSLIFKDTAELLLYPMIFPENISNIKLARGIVNFRDIDLDYIDIIRGYNKKGEVFIVDQNNNKNFTDDPVRILERIDWTSPEKSIKCEYLFNNGNEIIEDSSWIRVGIGYNGRPRYGRDEYIAASFKLDNNEYKIGLIDLVFGSSFNYGANPEIALLAKNSSIKDSLNETDLLKKKEYLNLNDNYYMFDSITNDGKYITLVKEENFDNKIGTQVGMIAPEFKCVSVKGDTISSVNLVDKPIVVANSCGCGGDTLSTKAYFDIKNMFGNKIFALRLDSGIENSFDSWQIDMKEKYNKDIHDKYRQAYCSRIAYVIGSDKRIKDKFNIMDWKAFLPKHINIDIGESNN